MRIGVFDSGVGGLSVVKSLLQHQLFEEIVYFGDTARVPYGVKDKNTIIRYALEAVEFFKNFDIDLLITACNTVSAYALDEMREYSNFDVVGVVKPGIIATENVLRSLESEILIIGTQATIASQAYEQPLRAYGFTNITSKATGLFVPMVEEGLYDGPVLQAAMKHYFRDIKIPDAIILGCTHFPLISDAIKHYFNHHSTMIHSGEAIVEYLEQHYALQHKFDATESKFFASENPEGLKNVAKKWLAL